MKLNKKESLSDDSMLFPAYGNTIGWVAILFGLLTVIQSSFSWRIIEMEWALYLGKCGFLIGFGFFVVSKNMFNSRAGLSGRLGALMSSVGYGIVILMINPIISHLKGKGLSTTLEPTELMINICIFYFIVLFTRFESKPNKEPAKNAQVEN